MRTILGFIVFIFSYTTSMAQAARFDGGLFIGGVTSQVSGDGLGGWNKFGFAAGAFVKMNFSDRWGTVLSMHYTMKGSAKPADPKNNDFDQFSYRLNYIDVPVMLEYRQKQLLVHAGPYVGVLVSQQQDYNGSKSNPSPLFETLDIGGTFGVGYMMGEKLGVEFRGQTSMIPTRPAPNVTNTWSYYEQGNYNQVLLFLVSYSL